MIVQKLSLSFCLPISTHFVRFLQPQL